MAYDHAQARLDASVDEDKANRIKAQLILEEANYPVTTEADPILVDRGVTAPLLIESAARTLGGRAGGKPHLAFGGGGNAAALAEALAGVPERLSTLLAGG